MGRTGEDRRDFLAGSALTAGALALDALLGGRPRAAAQSISASHGQDSAARPTSQRDFRRRAYELRVEVARQNREATPERLSHPNNGDEERYPRRFASYTKGLKHEDSGDVLGSSYDSLLKALASGKFEAFEAIAQGGARKQVNPQSGLAFELIGGDPRCFVQKPPPAFASSEEAAEMAENYWMALLRDVPFAAYASHPVAQAAAADLTLFGADAKVPKDGQTVTPALLFAA
jgi:hypothetical protein